jgi:hypothetical protein
MKERLIIDLVGQQEPFVALVGAGASAIPPSLLPTWTRFNDMLLECLCEQLDKYSGDRQPTSEMLSRFRERRDETHFFAPDFQAQLMEEEIGKDYFRVWQSLETDK